ncbi:PREDICTED: uncharacterized protein LOC109133274 [Camelina sativa]|uniref:Uncharacterized protein LOC109133274 n=1 Tax=Camelina sativa TaxID=90675 RepID=A0ABM1RS22_CAMSA|nr:PREDICTED: uncharacterized protein LOC109133274 [Camelina sativa]
MESYRDLINNNKVVLDDRNYGFWKSRIKSIIGGIDRLAWKTVLEKWEEPTIKDESGKKIPKPESDWTDEEQKRSKFNSRALSAIHCSVGRKQLELIQGCETAKEACDILQIHYEGTTKVQSSRKDMLASRFENLRMEEHESISDFSSKLSGLAQEALTLGKTYKDQKLVKKFLRCLPSRLMGYKTALTVSQDLDNLSYGEVVGMLQAHEMELNGIKKPRGIALAVSKDVTDQGEEDFVSLLVRRFDRALRRIEQGQGQRKGNSFKKTSEDKKADMQCHECKGYGHFIRECPTIKLRYAKCTIFKGTGHTHEECVSNPNAKKEKYMISIEDESDNDSNSEEELINLVAMVGITEFENGEEVTDSDSEGEEVLDIVQSYKEVRKTLSTLGKENQGLVKEKFHLEALVMSLQDELMNEKRIAKDSLDLMKEKLVLSAKADKFEEELLNEKKKPAELQSELDQQYRKIHMFAGTKQLDKILSYGRTEYTHRGLGYNEDKGAKSQTTKFVSAEAYQSEKETSTRISNGSLSCYFCGKIGHFKRFCYKYWQKVCTLKRQGRFFWNGVRRQVWMKKADLYQSGSSVASGSGFRCNIAMITEEQEDTEPWFFDSGCSRHMTGTKSNLQNIKKLKGGTVTFRDGSHGFIQGKGTTCDTELPQLVNVYLVQGLRANLISISQLCDEGLSVLFTKVDWKALDESVQGLRANLISISQLCDEGLSVLFTKVDWKALDESGNIKLYGVRSGNNCYMWEKHSIKCYSAQGSIDLWHQRLGHMNTRNLTTLGKQVKIQHKKVQDVQSKSVLDLIHMDLMGPMQVESLAGKKYVFVLVDDYSIYTWVRFIREKSNTIDSFKILALQLLNERGGIKKIRSDHGGEFQNKAIKEFCEQHGIAHQFSAPRTLQEMARAMIHGNLVPKKFWAEALNTACYIINRVYVRRDTIKTPYELWKGKTPNLSYFHVFGCKCYILNNQDYLGKFDSRSDEGMFLGYAESSTAFRVYNRRTSLIMESVNVVFDD